MLVYCAQNCETAVEVRVIDWSKFAPHIAPPDMKCPDCKGTGYQLVSV